MNPWYNNLAEVLSLNGAWEFALREQTGVIQIPGCWEAQGFPRRIDGPAIFQRTVHIPPEWRGQCIQLQFDAVSYYVEVEVNGIRVGTHTGLWSPFAFDVSAAINPGEDNVIRLTVFKPGERFPVRESLAGFLPDVAVMFGGVWQAVRIIAFSGTALSDISVLPDAHSGQVIVSALGHTMDSVGELVARVQIYDPNGDRATSWSAPLEEEHIAANLTVSTPSLWEPDQPRLYTVEITLEDNQGVHTCVHRTVGFRTLTVEDEQLLFNGVPICLRGVLNWGWYPDILCPAPDKATIRDEFRRVRELGFNLVKLCLYVPSPLYFEVADEEGLFLWLELPMWLPEVTPRLRQQAPLEYADVLAAVHHHPSVVIYSLGCELDHTVDADLLEKLGEIVRGQTRGALLCDNSGSGEAYGGLDFDFSDFDDYHFYCDLQYFEPLVDHFSRDWRPPRPLIFGEFCDADDFRDLSEIAEDCGGELPWWLTEWNPLHPKTFVGYPAQRERMQQANVNLNQQALSRLSRQQSFVVRKTILEKLRSRAGMGGYVVTGIRNTPLSTSAMFDDFNRSKYEPAAFRQFNADSVLLLGRGRTRKWTHDGDRPAPFEPYSFVEGQRISFDIILSHAGRQLPGGKLTWCALDSTGKPFISGEQAVAGPLMGGRPQTIGRIAFAAPKTDEALSLQFQAAFEVEGRKQFQNTWPLWIFPAVREWPENIGLLDPTGSLSGLGDLLNVVKEVGSDMSGVSTLLTSTLTEDTERFLHGGGSVLLLQYGSRPLPALAQPFWRTAINIIGDHPAMNVMPHNGFVDLQFYGLATDWVFATDRLDEVLPDATNMRSLLRRLDARQFNVSDYLIEAQVGVGRIIASTLRFQGGLGNQPVGLNAHLAGRWLLYNILKSLV